MASESRAGAPRARFEPIDALRIEGFKSIRDAVEVEIKPLTILAGRNSAGKSSLIQPLLLLKQTLEAPYDPGPVLLDGPCVRFTQAQQTLWADPEEAGAPQEWMVGVRSGSTWVDTRYGLAGAELELIHTARESTQGAREVLGPGVPEAVARGYIDDVAANWLDEAYYQWWTVIERDRCEYALWVLDSHGVPVGPGAWFSIFNPEPFLHLIHLPGLRGNPERSYPITGVSQQFPGPFQTYTASVLMAWRDKRDPRLEGVRADLARLGLTGWVEPERREGTRVELKVSRWMGERPGTSRGMVNIADVGFGVSQVMPVVVALWTAAPGQLVHIEQPEIHLHPNAQVVMADLLLDAAKRGARLVVETHSSVLLKAIQVAVAEGRSEPGLVALHWFDRDADGVTRITTAALDHEGAFGAWPVDFADVELEIEKRFILAPMGEPEAT